MRSLGVWAAFCGAAALLLLLTSGAKAATAQVQGGAILGAASADGAVAHYLGVPFAAAPIAGLRWRPPQAVAPWQGVLETIHAAPACPQPLPPPGSFYQNEFFRTSERQSEDCLYLNVWTPAHGRDEKLPVMVWFYGGGFVQGSGSLPSFDGEALARRGVIVVTINYRLGPLGFLALPALDRESSDHVSGNYGLLDMIAALRWVQDDAAAFGGDSDNVTIFGQSAGAFGVNAMMASPLAHGLFRRAIVESYPMFGMADPLQTLAQAEQGGEKFASAAGSETLADLRMVPSAGLVRAMGANAVGFGLRPNVDGHVLPHDLPEMIAAHDSNGAALLIGANFDEGTELLKATTPDGLTALARRRFGAEGDPVAALYTGADDEHATAAQDRMQSDYLLAASAREAQAFAEPGRSVYVYRFTRLAPGSDPIKVGAFHSAELAYVFGTQTSIDRPWFDRDRALSEQMQQYWTNFAKTGNPNGAGLPEWPRFGASAQDVMELGDATRPISVLDPQRKALFDAYLATRLPK
ncbi:carboxylesterase/lipase family protein [Methylocapsa sp. S129]|uniref:carboxylesterase/lipase family protein n=1 Tax=Methylocapsa sp. S129 TaxID=1641869 RepID=UPI00131C3988|nr:carboxylesterase family protein [Methylocapsa sp. S129]